MNILNMFSPFLQISVNFGGTRIEWVGFLSHMKKLGSFLSFNDLSVQQAFDTYTYP